MTRYACMAGMRGGGAERTRASTWTCGVQHRAAPSLANACKSFHSLVPDRGALTVAHSQAPHDNDRPRPPALRLRCCPATAASAACMLGGRWSHACGSGCPGRPTAVNPWQRPGRRAVTAVAAAGR